VPAGSLNTSSTIITPLYALPSVYTEYTINRLQIEPLTDVKAIRPEFGPVINNVTSFNYTIPFERCRDKNQAFNQSIFIGIVSAPENVDRRDSIRRTWMRHLGQEYYHQNLIDVVGIFFFMGQTDNESIQIGIEEEAIQHKDILQFAMMDDYYKLSSKTAAFFNWITNYCERVDFVLKIDDDVYVHVHNLASTVANLSPFENQLYGHMAENLFPIRGRVHLSHTFIAVFIYLFIYRGEMESRKRSVAMG
jgi:hypothetical protein